MATEAWPHDWDARVAGVGCPMCGTQGQEDNGFGKRILQGEYADVFLQRATPQAGYAIAIWKHGHVAEPTDLDDDAHAGYSAEVAAVGRALKTLYRPAKMNYQTLGNAVPHLHTHILARYIGDPAPGHPLPWQLIESANPIPEDEFQAQVEQLRGLIGSRGR